MRMRWMAAVASLFLGACTCAGDTEVGRGESEPRAVASARPASGPPATVPPLPEPDVPPLASGTHILGQVWRLRDGAWTALLPADTDPVEKVFAVGSDLYAVSWTAVHRIRDDSVVEVLRTDDDPRLVDGWGDPALGVFAVGAHASVFHARGDGPLTREETPGGETYVNVAITGGGGRVYVGTSNGTVLVSSGDGSWSAEESPLDPRSIDSDLELGCYDGRRALFATEYGRTISSTGEGQSRVASEAAVERDPRSIDELLDGVQATGNHAPIEDLAVDPTGAVWAVRDGEVLRLERDGTWRRFPAVGRLMTITFESADVAWITGLGVVHRGPPAGPWERIDLGGGSQTITHLLLAGADLYVATSFMVSAP